jgi:outer membrane immunogenic protein
MTLAGTALAADLTPPPPPIFTWTGLYIGGYGGGEVTHTSYDTLVGPPLSAFSHLTPTDIASVDAAGSQSLDKGGFAMGGELGYNWQIGMFVLGFETDIGGVTGGTNTTRVGLIMERAAVLAYFFHLQSVREPVTRCLELHAEG